MCNRKVAMVKVQRRIDKLKGIVNAKFTDIDWLKAETNSIIEEYMVSGGLQPVKEISDELDLMSTLLIKTHENIERKKITERTRSEWEEIERQVTPPIPLDIPEGYKVCACWNCNRTFKRKGKTKYCSDKCTQEQLDANKRLKKTGTYLAPYRDNYRPKREETSERMRKRKEQRLVE